jgi:hypothetical protein
VKVFSYFHILRRHQSYNSFDPTLLPKRVFGLSSRECSAVNMKVELHSAFYIILWITCGYAMIVFNKVVLTTWSFNYPFFLTFWHMLFATMLTQTLSRTTNLLPGVKEAKVNSRDYYGKFVPMSILFSLGVVCGNGE